MDDRTIERDPEDIEVMAAVVGDERYIVVFRDGTRGEAIRQLGKWAADAELSFSWILASQCAERIRRTPKFSNVTCSQCGRSFGPGDHGFSFCEDHQ